MNWPSSRAGAVSLKPGSRHGPAHGPPPPAAGDAAAHPGAARSPGTSPPESVPFPVRRPYHISMPDPGKPRVIFLQALSGIGSWGGKLVFPIPELEIVSGGVNNEGRTFLFCGGLGMRMRDGVTNAPEADGDDRGPAAHVACHALLRAFRPHGLRALPRLRRVVCQGFLPELRRDQVQRFRARRHRGAAVQDRHLGTGGSPSSTPA